MTDGMQRRQLDAIAERIAELNRRLEGTPQAVEPEEEKTPRPGWVKALGPVGIVLFFVLTKGKLLALGLTKAGTLLSMLAAFCRPSWSAISGCSRL